MPTNTGGGTTVSLDNTPQAVDDLYGASFGATEDQIYILDVMANDLGGRAKVLWSIDNSSDDGSGDLVPKDVVGCPEYSELGARITLTADGKIAYDTSTLDRLSAGERATDQFTYAIRMSNGTLSWATVTISVVGTNDAPVVQAVAIAAIEDGAAVTASFNGDDVDGDDDAASLIYAVTSGPAEGAVVNNEDGTFTFNPGADFQDLAEGETRQVTFTYTATDRHGAVSNTGTVTVTVTGTNDAPAVQDVAAAANEDGAAVTASFSGDDGDSDDDGGSLVYAITSSPGEGSVINNNNGTFTFDPGADFQDLAEGETRQVSFTYIATDNHDAGSDTATVTITVTGTNDGPDAVADLAGTDEDSSVLIDVLANDSDPDTSDVLTVSAASVTSGLGSATIEANQVRYDPGSAYNYLAVGESAEVVLSYSISDGNGGSDTATVTITVTGTNDGPEVSGAVLATIDEDDASPASVNLLANASDPDASDDLDVASVAYTVTGGAWAAAVVCSVDAQSGALTFDPGQFNALGAAESIELTFTYNVVDGNGGVTPASAVITITGSNDAPDIHLITTDSASAILTETNAGLSTSGTLTVNDPDTSDVVSSSVTAVVASGTTAGLGLTNAQLLAMLGVSPTTGLPANAADTHNLTWNFNSGTEAFDYLNAGQSLTLTYTVTSSDGNGGSDTQSVTVTINGTADNAAPTANNDAWVLSDLTLLPAGTITAAWFLNNDADPDSPSLFVTNVTGLPVGMTANYVGGHLVDITGTTPAVGSFSLTYTMTDGVNSTTATVAVTVLDTTANANTFTLDSNDFSYVDLLSGADTMTGDAVLTGNAGKDIFVGSAGNDVLSGGAGDDQLYGSGNDDTLKGGAGNDLLDGGNNNDTLNGGLGNDILTGGAADDIFIFDSALGGNVDTITDLDADPNNDKIYLENGIFTALIATGTLAAANFSSNAGGNATNANHKILYDTATGDLFYDADGSGGGAKILFAHIILPLLAGAVDAADFVVI